MLWKLLLLYMCYYSIPGAILADDMFVYIKLDDNTNYDIHRCGSIVRVKEKQKIEFYIPNNVQYVSCHNPFANMVMNVTTATLAMTRYVTTHVTDQIEGQWKCNILYTQDKSTQIYLMNGFSLNFDVEYAQEVVISKDSQRYVINNKCCVHLFYYKENDNLTIECSLPGVKTAQLKTGNLKWRFCEHEDDDKLSCETLDPVTTRSSNFTGLMEYKNNKATIECIYTSKYGVESIIKILFELVPLKPPILTLNGRQYRKAFENSTDNTYIGHVDELLEMACNSTEEGWHLATDWEDNTYSNKDIIEYRHNLTAEDNGTLLLCTYSGSKDKGASVAVNLEVYLAIDNEEGTDVVPSKVGLVIGLSVAIILSVVAAVLCSLVKKKKTFRRPPLTTDPVQRPAAPLPETEHIYYTIDYNDDYSYTDPQRS